MIKKILSYQSKTLTGAALVLGFASLLSRIVGVARDRILAHQFGAGIELDIYTSAFRIPDFIYNLLIVGALSAGFIPLFLEIYNKDKKDAWKFTSNVINIIFIAIGLISLGLYFFTPELLKILVPGFSQTERITTIELTRVMLWSPIILGLSAVVSSVLQSLRSFFIYSLAPILYNLGIILGAIFLVPHFGLLGLAYGVVIGALLHLLIQIPILYKAGFHYQRVINIRDTQIRKLSKTMIPRTLTLASVQCTTLFITSFASVLGAGSIAIFNFANNIYSLPIGIIAVSFAIAVFPTLSEYAAAKDFENFKKQLSLTTRQILFFILPATVLFILLRAQIVRVLLGSGAFNWNDTITTANTVGIFSLSLFSQSLLALLNRAFYALQNTKTPLFIAVISMGFTAALSFYFKNYFGVTGLALGISIGSIFQVILLWMALRKKLGKIDTKNILFSVGKISIACIALAFVTQELKYPISLLLNMDTFVGIFFQGLFSGLAGILVYGVVSYLLKVHEMQLLCSSLHRKWLKLRNIPLDEDSLK